MRAQSTTSFVVLFPLSGVVSVAFHDITEIFMTSASKSRQTHCKQSHVCFQSCDLKFIARPKNMSLFVYVLLFMVWMSWRRGLFFDRLAYGFFFFLIFPPWQRYNLPMKRGINHPNLTTHSCLFAIELLQIELIFRIWPFPLSITSSCSWSCQMTAVSVLQIRYKSIFIMFLPQ